ncbi:hypothetical protein [Nonomuraea jabiensis]|uniref:hypothetical protein n=1 Tax=Nonomuraea jabiensis TaxID=882448 RepID=UPI003D752753
MPEADGAGSQPLEVEEDDGTVLIYNNDIYLPALKLQCEWWKAMCRLIFSKKLTKKIYNAWFVASGSTHACLAPDSH